MSRMFLLNCRVVDGTGAPAVEDALLVIDRESGDIVFVGPQAAEHAPVAETTDLVLDLQGNTVVPGLSIAHPPGAQAPFTPYRVRPVPPGIQGDD